MSTAMKLFDNWRRVGRVLGRTLLSGAFALAVLSVSACSDDDSHNPPEHEHDVAAVTLDRTTASMQAGDHMVLKATATCGCGDVLSAPITWTSSDVAVASVDAGEVTALKFGTVTITAAAGGITAAATIEVMPLGTVIGPEGGTVTSADGNAVLDIPAGAIATLTDIVLAPVADAVFGGDPLFIGGSGYEILPATLQLQERAQLRIRIDPARVPAGVFVEQLRIRERDREQNQWRACEHAGLQLPMVAAWADGPGTYGMVVQPATGTMVGPEGGTVVSADGMAEVLIPAGALSAPTDITITKAGDAEFLGDPLYIPGTAYDLQPEGLQFNLPVRLHIHYEPGNLPEGVEPDRLRIRERDRVQNRWRDCEHAQLQQNAVEANIQHFTIFAIVANEAPVQIPTTVVVLGMPSEFSEGDVVQLYAEVLDAAGNVIPDADVVWSSDNPAVATVDQTGLVTAVASGSATISAAAGGAQGGKPVTVTKKVASVTVLPPSATVIIGGTTTFTAEARDEDGNLVNRSATWSSSATSIATVSDGVVTGVSVGIATITARVQGVSGDAAVTVSPPVSSVAIADPGHQPLEIGLTKQLTATAYNALGQPVSVTFVWTSSDDNIASVDNTGLVTGVGRGTAIITASVGTASASVSINVVGESTTEGGNNLAWPMVFAEGIGITGSPVATDPGVRPTVESGIVVDALPFFYSGCVADYNTYYMQGTACTWRPEYIDGSGQSPYDANITWGDNITARDWSATRPIRVEHSLTSVGLGTLKGFPMTYLYGDGPTEMYGTNGIPIDMEPMIYTTDVTVKVEEISGIGGNVIGQVLTTTPTTEVNIAGKIIWGFLLKLDAWGEGYYRITFTLGSNSNVRLVGVNNSEGSAATPILVNNRTSSIDIRVDP